MKTIKEIISNYNFLNDEFIVYNFLINKLGLPWKTFSSVEEYIKNKNKLNSLQKIVPSILICNINTSSIVRVGYKARLNFEIIWVEGGKVVSFLRQKTYGAMGEGGCKACGAERPNNQQERVEAFYNQVRCYDLNINTLEAEYEYVMAWPYKLIKIDLKTNLPVDVRDLLTESIEGEKLIKEISLFSDLTELVEQGIISLSDGREEKIKKEGLLEIALREDKKYLLGI